MWLVTTLPATSSPAPPRSSDRSPCSRAWLHPRRPLCGHFTCLESEQPSLSFRNSSTERIGKRKKREVIIQSELLVTVSETRNVHKDDVVLHRSEEHTSELQSLRHLVCR